MSFEVIRQVNSQADLDSKTHADDSPYGAQRADGQHARAALAQNVRVGVPFYANGQVYLAGGQDHHQYSTATGAQGTSAFYNVLLGLTSQPSALAATAAYSYGEFLRFSDNPFHR